MGMCSGSESSGTSAARVPSVRRQVLVRPPIRFWLIFFLVCRQATATHCLRLLQQRVDQGDQQAVHFVVSSVLSRLNLSKAELASAKDASSNRRHRPAAPFLQALDSAADASVLAGSSRGDSKQQQQQPAASRLRYASFDSVGFGLLAADKKGDEEKSPTGSPAFARALVGGVRGVSSGSAAAGRSKTLTAAWLSRQRSDSAILAQSRQSRSSSSSLPAGGVAPGLVGGSRSRLAFSSSSAFLSADAGSAVESVAARLVRQIAERHAEIRRLEEMNARDEALLLQTFD
jgi:hypothetical protein